MASRLVSDAERGDQRRLQGDEQEQEAEREHDADHERRLRGERLLEVVVLGRRRRRRAPRPAAPRGAGRSCGRRPGSTGRRSGSPGSATRPLPPGCGGETRAMPGSRAATAATAAALARAGRRSGARRARRRRTPAAPARSRPASASLRRDDLDRGHAGLQPEDRQREQHEDRASPPGRRGAGGARAARPSGRSARERCSPECTQRQRRARRPSGRASPARRAAASASRRARRRR